MLAVMTSEPVSADGHAGNSRGARARHPWVPAEVPLGAAGQCAGTCASPPPVRGCVQRHDERDGKHAQSDDASVIGDSGAGDTTACQSGTRDCTSNVPRACEDGQWKEEGPCPGTCTGQGQCKERTWQTVGVPDFAVASADRVSLAFLGTDALCRVWSGRSNGYKLAVMRFEPLAGVFGRDPRCGVPRHRQREGEADPTQ
jgi:hypothetical protein